MDHSRSLPSHHGFKRTPERAYYILLGEFNFINSNGANIQGKLFMKLF